MKAKLAAILVAVVCVPAALSAQRCPAGTQIGRVAVVTPGAPTPVVTARLIQGTGSSELARGLGHWTETAMPGQGDIVAFSGHRTTYGAWLNGLDWWPKGTVIRLHMTYPKRKSFCYKLTGTRVVPEAGSRWRWEARSRGYEILTTWACHPKGQRTHRIIGFWWPTKC